MDEDDADSVYIRQFGLNELSSPIRYHRPHTMSPITAGNKLADNTCS